MSKIVQHRPSIANPFIAGGVRVHPKQGMLKKKRICGKAVKYRTGPLAGKCKVIKSVE